MTFRLDNDIFDIVKNESKNIELRLNDEKRQKLSVGDTITFLKRPDEIESITAKITKLEHYNNFDEVIDELPMERIYKKNTSKEKFINIIRRFYTKEDEEKYGILAIYFTIIK